MPRGVLLLHSSAGRYGADVQLEAIVAGLDRDRWTPTCVLPEEGPLTEALVDAGAEVVVHPLAVLRRSKAGARGAAELSRAIARDRRVLGDLARERDVAIVHDNTSVALSGAAAARRAGAAHVVHVREIWPTDSPVQRALWPRMRRRLSRADALIGISRAVCEQFPPGRATLIHDGLHRSPQPPPRAEARAALGLPADRFVVAVIGRVHPWKGQEVLARALAAEELREIGAIGVVAGDAIEGGGAAAELDHVAREAGVEDRLVRLGFREDVDTVLGAADAVAVPSTRPEPLGLVALEAAAAGLPVVASADGGLRETVDDGRSGLLFHPGGAGALAAALIQLAGQPDRRAAMGEAGRRLVAERFSAERARAQLAAVYDRF